MSNQQQYVVVPNGKAGQVFVDDYLVTEGYPAVGVFAPNDDGKKALKKFYSYVPDEFLDLWVETAQLTYKPCENAQIARMRKCMAIMELHYPSAPKAGGASGKGKYSDLATEWLVAQAVEHNVPVEVCEDDRILRMRVIMALRAAGKLEAR